MTKQEWAIKVAEIAAALATLGADPSDTEPLSTMPCKTCKMQPHFWNKNYVVQFSHVHSSDPDDTFDEIRTAWHTDAREAIREWNAMQEQE